MNVYVLKELDKDAEYEEMDGVIGVFSTYEKAKAIMEKEAKEIFWNSKLWIETWILDDFSWERIPQWEP